MKTVGLTGPSGSGKTCFAEILTKKGFPCINADELYHSMLIPPSEVLDAIQKKFGSDFFLSNGELDRKKLAAHVFSDTSQLELLNSTVLPLVKKQLDRIANEHKVKGAPLLIIDAPTLFEAGYDKSCDITVSVLAPKDERVIRISARDHITKEDALLRTQAQKPDSFYIERSDKIIYNNGDESELIKRASDLLRELGLSESEGR